MRVIKDGRSVVVSSVVGTGEVEDGVGLIVGNDWMSSRSWSILFNVLHDYQLYLF